MPTMSDIASKVPPAPLPDRAWNGRSWWLSCCLGCALTLLVLVGIIFLFGGWAAKAGFHWGRFFPPAG